MRQTGLLGVAVLGLALSVGCRSSCTDRCGRTGLASRIGCREPARAVCAPGVPTSLGRAVAVAPADTLPAAGWTPDAGYGYPVYPGGEPIPLGTGGTAPLNELPPPGGYQPIPAPNVPETPAQPMPAIPAATTSLSGSSAPRVGEPRQPK